MPYSYVSVMYLSRIYDMMYLSRIYDVMCLSRIYDMMRACVWCDSLIYMLSCIYI